MEERLSQVEKAGAEDRTLAKKREAELNLRMKEKFAKDEQKILLKLNQNIDDIERKSLTKQLDALRKRQDNNLAEEKNYWKEMANISAKYGLTAINKAFLKADEDLLVHRKKTALGKISKQKTDAIDAAREKQEDAMFALNATFKGEDLKDLEGNRMYNTRKALIDKRYADSKLAAEKTSFMQAETTQEQFQTDSIKSVSRYYRDIIKNEQYTFSERQQLVREGFAAIGKLYEKGRMNADQYRNALLDIKSSQLELERAMALATPFDSLMNNWDKFIDRFGDTRDRLKKDVFDKMTSDFKSFFRGLIESPKDFLKNFIPSIEKMRGAIYAKMAERRAEAEISQRIEAGEEMTFAKQAGIGFKWAQIYNIAKLRNAGKDITKVMKEINKVIGNVSEKDIASVGNPLDSYGTISKKKIDDIAKYGKEKLSKMTGGLIIDEVMVKKVAGLTDKIKNVLADETIPVEEQRAIVRQKLVTANIPKYTDATQRVMQVVSDTGTPELKDKMQKITQVIESYYMPKKMDETGVMANVSFNILPGAIDMLKTTFKTLLPSLEVLVKPILKPNSLSVLPSLALDMGSVAGMPGQSAIQPATQVNNTEMSVNFHGITDTQSMVDLLKQEVLDAIDMRGFRK